MSDDLVKALRDSKGWPTLGNAAADRIQTLEAALAFYKGFHDGIYSTGTHVVVERTLLNECEQALMAIDRDNNNPKRFNYRIADIVHTTLTKLRAQAHPK